MKYFTHPEGVTVSELQMMALAINRNLEYKTSLRIIREELQGKKQDNRFWLANRDRVWKYFCTCFEDNLKKLNINSMNELIKRTQSHFA